MHFAIFVPLMISFWLFYDLCMAGAIDTECGWCLAGEIQADWRLTAIWVILRSGHGPEIHRPVRPR